MAIFLIGFMGVGKTTVGREIGLLQDLPVIDMDHFIEEQEGRAIKEIFREEGEDYFRTIETQALKELKKKEAVITTGGGVIERIENRDMLMESGKVIHLYCSFEELWGRLEGDSERPLVQKNSREELRNLYNRRMPLYRSASHSEIDTTGKSIEETINELRHLVGS
ncbi:shikimate kinase [Rossellomorea aquimaris]|uniref:shikimate kinase n=1 Tax=Rossellomorea aquimaris TaxID=189382 RepID=UPI001CD3E6B3|nr:shikimate kinase [Rossellomorea aquimaris]MCA1054805.1 shikimate kinase [Rossellomorea aquimaris]